MDLKEISAQVAEMKEKTIRNAITEEARNYPFCNSTAREDLVKLIRPQLDGDLCGVDGASLAEVVEKEYLARPQFHPQKTGVRTSDLKPQAPGFDLQNIRSAMSREDREHARAEILKVLREQDR
jgi:hypothetical protein